MTFYRCIKCGYFYIRKGGRYVRKGLNGTQTQVIPFVCPRCR